MDVLRSSNSYADDTAALAGGVPYGGLYRTDSIVKINLLGNSPGPTPGEVEIGSLIWTDANSTIVASSGGTIPILTTNQEVSDALNNGTAAAIYFDLDSSNAGRGLFYNKLAAAAITPPTGFRFPTQNDWNNLKTELTNITGNSSDITSGGGGSNAFWNQTIKSDPDYGASGFDSIKAGWAIGISSAGAVFYTNRETYWTSEGTVGVAAGFAFNEQTSIIQVGSQTGGNPYYTIRFCKDV
jgi:uncharacterized protein (TIGR02145 family)